MADTIRYRRTRWQIPWYVALTPLYVTWRILADPDQGAAAKTVTAALVVVMIGATVAMARTVGVMLRSDALVVYGIPPKRVIPWRDIQWMGVTSTLGTKQVAVRTPNDLITLRAPAHTPFVAPDRDFQAKADTIYFYWLRQTRQSTGP